MSLRRLLVSLLVIGVLSAAGYWAYVQYLAPREESSADTAAPSNVLAVDTDPGVVSAEGTLVPGRYARLAFETGGRVAEILVEEGGQVRAGDPLVRLETDLLENQLRQAEAMLAQAEAGVSAAEAAILAAQSGVGVAASGVSQAEARLALVQAGSLPEQIQVADSNISVAEAAVAQAVASRDAALEIRQSQIRSAEAQVAAALAEERVLQESYDNLLRNGVGGAPEEQARFALNAAAAGVTAAQALLDELNAGPTLLQRRLAESAVAVAEAQLASAQAQRELLLAGPKPEQVAASEAAVDQAEAALAQAEAVVDQAEVGSAQAEASVSQARAAVEAATLAIEKMILRAPFDARVAELAVKAGEIAAPGLPVVVVADFTRWLVETTDLTELDVVSVAVGSAVELRVDAIPDTPLEGTVVDIAEVASLTRGDVTFVVTIQLPDQDLPLRWGMTVFVDVDVGR